jgi:hypothetical protein
MSFQVDWQNGLPPAWLVLFSRVIPGATVSILSGTCRRFRKELTRNAAWIRNCEELEDFSQLTFYERYTMIQPEGFWYEWYQEHLPRRFPLRSPCRQNLRMERGRILSMEVPQVGSLAIERGSGIQTVFVCVRSIDKKMYWAPCGDDLIAIMSKQEAVATFASAMPCTIRSSGAFSLDISLVAIQLYP